MFEMCYTELRTWETVTTSTTGGVGGTSFVENGVTTRNVGMIAAADGTIGQNAAVIIGTMMCGGAEVTVIVQQGTI